MHGLSRGRFQTDLRLKFHTPQILPGHVNININLTGIRETEHPYYYTMIAEKFIFLLYIFSYLWKIKKNRYIMSRGQNEGKV